MDKKLKVMIISTAVFSTLMMGAWSIPEATHDIYQPTSLEAKVVRKKAISKTTDSTAAKEDEEDTTKDGEFTKSQQKIIDLVNKEREKNNLPALEGDVELCKVSAVRAKEIVDEFSHKRPDGTSYTTLLDAQKIKYKYFAENIAAWQKTEVEVMESWMNSEGHCANILDKKMTKIGVAKYTDPKGDIYWVQTFIGL